ncbi:hypothetical protein ACNT2N_09615 [Pseudomonas thivervalensis]|uniref:Nucleotidyl transferase AbiEii toxin, Type IV TA system n=1 Tax=Pseudomonas thivervalensis TaxID=86265 RepID=A0A176NPF4_9PSED|nr:MULTISPECIES: hypothetical protein [Pseudomonas]AOS39392.1 hypothetical protein A0U95_11640 [Pseudomonas brassicacearum]AXA55598.1 hypothetical protein CE140_14910 [Pseudomonas thivervalensis]AXA61415.1 hypothetical protein CEQ51_15465 [Pseudomonas thivervalensis]OAB53061.1 hypothetical protein APS14_03980 [Pseudomonas thivervalensis]SDG11055.1 hypothetical protein SAMN04490204_3051 [Pseudomonas thivervalensis]
MVVGVDRFREYFRDFQDSYVLIGGVAASIAMEELGAEFRLTKDLDIVLVVEALDRAFVGQFWKFIKDGGYAIRQNGDSSGDSPVFYRFQNPEDKSFPVQVELFSRVPDGLEHEEAARMTKVPVEEQAASLSAIILDDEYYAFLLAGVDHTQEISHIGADRLVPLKAHAWLNKKALLEQGIAVDSRDIKKHFRDVIVLAVGLTEGMAQLPERLALDLKAFLNQVPAELASNPQAYKGVNGDRLIKTIQEAFSLA